MFGATGGDEGVADVQTIGEAGACRVEVHRGTVGTLDAEDALHECCQRRGYINVANIVTDDEVDVFGNQTCSVNGTLTCQGCQLLEAFGSDNLS